jgi:hypothetical protein
MQQLVCSVALTHAPLLGQRCNHLESRYATPGRATNAAFHGSTLPVCSGRRPLPTPSHSIVQTARAFDKYSTSDRAREVPWRVLAHGCTAHHLQQHQHSEPDLAHDAAHSVRTAHSDCRVTPTRVCTRAHERPFLPQALFRRRCTRTQLTGELGGGVSECVFCRLRKHQRRT